ncbi:hypothetical protein GCM10027047_11620 [Rhodococcus aerolatus]
MTELGAPLDWWSRQVEMAYQPVVDLDSRTVVGYEALARGPLDSPLHSPSAFFTAARALGAVAEADWACRAAAVRGALDAHLPEGLQLFVNVEPAALGTSGPASVVAAAQQLSVVVELTERGLAADPATLLRAADGIRACGFGIAVDDVGAEPSSLALLPFLRPEVIKLDLRLVQTRTDTDVADIITAVNAEAERTGAVVLAEGIETEEQAQLATMMGARLGQGWLFGKAEPLPRFPAPRAAGGGRRHRVAGVPRPPEVTRAHGRPGTPFDLVAGTREVRRSTKALLTAVSRVLERQARTVGDSAVVLSTFQRDRHLTPATLERYTDLASSAALVAVFGTGVAPEPGPGLRGVPLDHDDPLAAEWDVVVVGPHVTAALLARDVGDDGPDAERRFDYRVVYDRDTVLEAGRRLLQRVRADPAD